MALEISEFDVSRQTLRIAVDLMLELNDKMNGQHGVSFRAGRIEPAKVIG